MSSSKPAADHPLRHTRWWTPDRLPAREVLRAKAEAARARKRAYELERKLKQIARKAAADD